MERLAECAIQACSFLAGGIVLHVKASTSLALLVAVSCDKEPVWFQAKPRNLFAFPSHAYTRTSILSPAFPLLPRTPKSCISRLAAPFSSRRQVADLLPERAAACGRADFLPSPPPSRSETVGLVG